MSDWSCRQREARSHLRLFHLVLGSHDGRALVPIPKRSAYPASDLDVVVVDSLKALDPNRPIREDIATRQSCAKVRHPVAYSITSSATTSSVGGTVRPSAFCGLKIDHEFELSGLYRW